MADQKQVLIGKFQAKTAVGGVVGMGYVGLPLAVEMAKCGYRTIGLEVNKGVVEGINGGRSHIQDIPTAELAPLVKRGLIRATAASMELREADAISICVPTPLGKTKDPDLSYVIAASEAVRDVLRKGQLVVLESTTYPGTTRELVLPILEQTGLKVGEDFFLCFSPERVDPGNPKWHTKNTPKVLGGVTPACLEVAQAFYGAIFDTIVPVESAEAAELVKVYENTFRMINIALANELAQACDRLGVDVWNVIDAAATKPFGFMKFTPGPGLGGHCIPLDPHYLSWKMRTLNYKTRLIELSSEISAEMPMYVTGKVVDVLNDERKALKGARVLVLGVAYKPDIDDLRESPALEVIQHLQEKGAEVRYHDPFVAMIREDGHTPIQGLPLSSVALTDAELEGADVVVVVTDHRSIDWQRVADVARLVVDSRGALRATRPGRARVVGLSGTGRPAALPAGVR